MLSALLSRWFAPLVLAAALSGCVGGTVDLRGDLAQPPLVEQLEVTVGSFFPGKSRGYVMPTAVVRMNAGEAATKLFRQSWDALFLEVVDLPDWPPWRSQPPAVDGVIELADLELEAVFGDKADSKDRVYVRYEVCLYEPDGVLVKCWTAEARSRQQRRLADTLHDMGGALARQVDEVMREALALFLVQFDADPDVRHWAAGKAAP
jgi:hypothetical protein